jgi:FkbM family methyltransferase
VRRSVSSTTSDEGETKERFSRMSKLRPLLRHAALYGASKQIRMPESPSNRYQEFFHLKELLKALEIDCVIDVGANTGQYVRDLRAMGYQGLIYSFEPVARSFRILEAQFRDDQRWHGFQMALGSQNARATINVVPSLTEMSSLLAPRGDWGVEQEETEVRRLDEVLGEVLNGTRTFLKMDTQGYDLRVFEGAAGCINWVRGLESELSVRPLYEGMPGYLEALSAYGESGFELSHLSVVARGPEDELFELNCFMRRGNN